MIVGVSVVESGLHGYPLGKVKNVVGINASDDIFYWEVLLLGSLVTS